jgi:hypothetical protein
MQSSWSSIVRTGRPSAPWVADTHQHALRVSANHAAKSEDLGAPAFGARSPPSCRPECIPLPFGQPIARHPRGRVHLEEGNATSSPPRLVVLPFFDSRACLADCRLDARAGEDPASRHIGSVTRCSNTQAWCGGSALQGSPNCQEDGASTSDIAPSGQLATHLPHSWQSSARTT